jgi:hypothetical protein
VDTINTTVIDVKVTVATKSCKKLHVFVVTSESWKDAESKCVKLC